MSDCKPKCLTVFSTCCDHTPLYGNVVQPQATATSCVGTDMVLPWSCDVVLPQVQKGSVVVFLRFDSINQIVFDDAEPRSILISCRDERRYGVVCKRDGRGWKTRAGAATRPVLVCLFVHMYRTTAALHRSMHFCDVASAHQSTALRVVVTVLLGCRDERRYGVEKRKGLGQDRVRGRGKRQSL